MEKKTLQQLSQNQPFPHLYLIGSTHQIFQKKRNKRYKFPGWSASFCITSTFLFRTQNCSLLAQLWSKGSQGMQIRRSLFFTMVMQHCMHTLWKNASSLISLFFRNLFRSVYGGIFRRWDIKEVPLKADSK